MNSDVQTILKKEQADQAIAIAELADVQRELAPFIKKASQLLVDFEPVRLAALALASDASRLQRPPDDVTRLVNELFSICSNTPVRINSAIGEAENLSIHSIASPAERQSHISHLVFNLNPEDIGALVRSLTAQLKETLADLARVNGGPPTTAEIPTLAKVKDSKVTVESRYRVLK
jgi:hypothetical protein